MNDATVTHEHPDEDQQRAEKAREEVERGKANATVESVTLIILTVLAVLYTLSAAQEIILPFVLALVLNLLLQPAKRFLCNRLRFPAALASFVLILALFGVVAGIGTAISLPASTWVSRAPEALPKLQQKLGALQGPIQYVQKGMDQIEQAIQKQGGGGGEEKQQDGQTVTVKQSSGIGGIGMTVLTGTRTLLGHMFTIVIILFFLLWAGETLLRSLVEIMPTWTDKRRVVAISNEIESNISGYLATITVMNALVGIANGLATWACGLPDPLLWGTLAFLLNYIPILGPFSGVVIFFAVGLFTYSNLLWAFVPAGIYLVIHIVEGETVTPMLLASRFTLNPVLVILSLFFWDWMWGVTGALLAVPLLAIAKIFCDHIETLTPLGHLIGGAGKTKKAKA